VPFHSADWFSDRGEVKGAFSYGIFQDGTPSRVVIINRTYIDKVRRESKGSESPKSPWVKWFDQMVLKTVAHRLEPWVPTSTEWRKEQLRAGLEVAAEQNGPAVINAAPAAAGPAYPEPTSPEDFNDEGPVEGELVD
jgi:recombination protein RecT